MKHMKNIKQASLLADEATFQRNTLTGEVTLGN